MCDKLTLLEEELKVGGLFCALPLVAAIRQDCQRMEAKLVANKAAELLRESIG